MPSWVVIRVPPRVAFALIVLPPRPWTVVDPPSRSLPEATRGALQERCGGYTWRARPYIELLPSAIRGRARAHVRRSHASGEPVPPPRIPGSGLRLPRGLLPPTTATGRMCPSSTSRRRAVHPGPDQTASNPRGGEDGGLLGDALALVAGGGELLLAGANTVLRVGAA